MTWPDAAAIAIGAVVLLGFLYFIYKIVKEP